MNKVVSKDGTEIAYEKTGHGFPLILVGGALSERSASVPLAPLLAPHFTVFAFDRRGRGDSGDTAPYAVGREIEDIQALIGEAGGSAFVFGHSSGSVLSLEAAASGLAIPKLAMYEPPFMVDSSRPPLPKDYREHLGELLTSGRRGDAVEYFMTIAVGVPPAAVAQMRHSPPWAKMESVAHTLPYDQAIMDRATEGGVLPAARWAKATMPLLVFDGGASPAWMRHAVEALVGILPSGKRRTLEGQTHRIDPALVAPLLVEFFGQNARH